jgi:hypothetical protein
MENDVLAKGCYRGLKITGLQCGRDGSLARTHGHTPGTLVTSHFTSAAFTSAGFSCAIQ